MLSAEDNELLARIGRGTPMGELFRRYWLPALLSAELHAPDAAPRRLRILGEDLIAFRDTNGRVGVVQAYCPHKLAPLFFGRNEQCGIRCVYHGWKFDADGNCVDIPNLPAAYNSQALREKAKILAYPTREAGGLVWLYMGPRERMPELPGLEWTRLPESHCHHARWLQCTNWAQGMEGEIDSSHISFLHSEFKRTWSAGTQPVQPTAAIPPGTSGAPVMNIKTTDYGFVYGARRAMDSGEFYWRLTHWFMPMYSMIPNNNFPYTGRAWVPIDDYHVAVFTYGYNADRPFTQAEIDFMNEGHSFPPPIRPAAYALPDGTIIDTFVPLANRSNDFNIDRERQKSVNFSGIGAITDQDRALQENMPSGFGLGPGKLVDRTREMLVPSDMPVVTARRLLLRAAKDLANGIEPRLPHQPNLYSVRSAAAVSPEQDLDQFLAVHGRHMQAAAE